MGRVAEHASGNCARPSLLALLRTTNCSTAGARQGQAAANHTTEQWREYLRQHGWEENQQDSVLTVAQHVLQQLQELDLQVGACACSSYHERLRSVKRPQCAFAGCAACGVPMQSEEVQRCPVQWCIAAGAVAVKTFG